MQAAVKQAIDTNNQVFIGRQPILDRELNTYAYELLFRPTVGNEADFLDGEKATAQVINNAIMEIGLDDLVGTNLAYINFTRKTLISEIAQFLPPERVVLEVLEDVEIDEELIQSIRTLVASGFTIALDDFEYDQKWEPLIPLADVIKFDVLAIGIDQLQDQVNFVKKHDVKLLAEKVETQEEFDQCKALGFDYFQGYFFAKPNVINSNKLPDYHIALLNLISRLQDSEIEIEEIEDLVSHNVSLTYKLLRNINSAFFSLPKKINSIRQAVIFFGLQRLKNWASLMAMTDIEGKPSELLQTGLVRARMCELLAIEAHHSDSDSHFMLGLFSILDALMDATMEDILEKLPISEEVADALLKHEGGLGAVLSCCLACEQNIWSETKLASIKDGTINKIYMESIIWSRQAMAGLT